MKTKKILGSIFVGLAGIILTSPTVFSQSIYIPVTGLPDPQGGILQIVTFFLNWLLAIIGIVAIISFIISGFQYFLAAGDEKQMEVAKRNLKYSIWGVIVALSGFVVVQAIDSALQGNTLF